MKEKKTRPSVWDDAYKPYGTNTGARGNPYEWQRFYKQAMGLDEAKTILSDSNPYSILGIPEGSPIHIIKKAFRKLCFKVHPDYGGTTEQFNKVYASYSVLMEE
jgi:DnaJ-class molecular chaperone